MRAQELITELDLQPLNMEAGLFGVVYVSAHEVVADDGPSRASNCIYYLLTRESPQNNLHWVWSDDYQILIEGGPADFFLFYADGRAEQITMGRDIANGQRLIVPCPGATYKAILLHDTADYLLTGSVVTPAWNPQRARIGGDEAFLDRYAGAAPWATPAFLRHLIGPNFGLMEGADGMPPDLTIDAAGQVLWKNMQLTAEQLHIEIQTFAANYAGKALVAKCVAAAPVRAITLVEQAARRAGLALTLERIA
jgi:predicted cupin superfamily sugar epimerase